MRLHWSPRSPFVRVVCVVAHEKNIIDRLERVRSPVAMTQPNAALMRDNPLNKLPTLVLDDGRILYDSRVINQFFDRIGEGAGLYPEDEDARLLTLQREALGLGFLDALVLWRNETTRNSVRQSPELLSAFEVKARATLDRLETEAPALAATKFFAGHIAIACALSYVDFRFPNFDWRDSRPALAAWHAAVAARPSMQATEFVDDL